MFNLNFVQSQFQIGPFEFSLVPDYFLLDLRLLAMILNYTKMHIGINLVILTWRNTLPNDCLNSVIDIFQGFHKLEINSFSSSSFSCTFMRENIWSMIWFFLWKSTNQRRFNCLLPSVLFSQNFILTFLSVFWLLTSECKNPSKKKCLQLPVLF